MCNTKNIETLTTLITNEALSPHPATDSEFIIDTLKTCLSTLNKLHAPTMHTNLECIKKEFGKTLRKHRKENNLTQEKLAQKAGTKAWNISRYENGKNICSLVTFIYFTEVLGFDFWDEVAEKIKPFIAQNNRTK